MHVRLQGVQLRTIPVCTVPAQKGVCNNMYKVLQLWRNVKRRLDSRTDGIAHDADILVLGPPTMHVLYAR